MSTAPLKRSRDDRVIAGVCGGLAQHLGLPPVVIRIAMGVGVLLGGAGALLYLWLWALTPLETMPGESGTEVPSMRRVLTRPADAAAHTVPAPVSTPPASTVSAEAQRAAPQNRVPVAELLLGGALVVAGVALVLGYAGVELPLDAILAGLVVLVGVGLAWWQIADRERPERHQLPRVLAALALVAVGVLMFFVTSRQPNALTVIAAALAVLAGVAFALAPWLLRLNRDLVAERSARAREAERAEIAAHLHDSVLQTLAAIQQRSAPGSEVSRLARAQERELREWLFRAADGGGEAERDAADIELRAQAATLEAEYAVRFEVVAVGASRADPLPEPMIAAAREAMLNAARHAGGDVTVYIEVSPEHAAIDVTDRGPGFALDRIPEGRMGVRESLIGRMQRAGGSARIVPGPGGTGTAVRLQMPLRGTADTVPGNGAHREDEGTGNARQ